MSASGGTRAIVAALAANFGIAVIKFVAFAITGSASMLAEGVHSVVDSGNQGLLLGGARSARRAATPQHPFGYGRDRYVYGFLVALMLFSAGGLFALYEGVEKIRHPHHLDSAAVAVIVLVVAIGLESLSLRTAIVESRKVKGADSWLGFIRHAKNPELPVVLLEDVAALLGLVFALGGVGLATLTSQPRWDGIGTCAIGLLLVSVAVVLVVETKSLLVGEAAAPADIARIEAELAGPGVQRLIHLRTMHLGPDELLVGAKVAMASAATLEQIAAAIDDAERRVRAAVPSARVIYVEPDIDRACRALSYDRAVPSVIPLDGAVRRYEWGSRTAIQQLLGEQPDGRPAAELWFGAHADDPSRAPLHDAGLDELIAADPAGLLGADAVAEFGPRLPFLLKVLAADTALSMQVHPDRAQAAEGYAREDAAGIARDAPDRNYRDSNHKPELLCALTPFDALCGFRPVAETLTLLSSLDVPELAFVAELLRGPDPLRAAFTALLTHDDPAPLVHAVAARASGAGEGPLYAVRLAAEHFPHDVGIVLTLLLNYVRLEPGEAIFLGAGNVHAYLRGTGVEVMANSDNVLRCGLTPKHVDVPELLRITDFTALADPRWHSVGGRFDVLVPDFSLTRLEVDEPTGLDAGGPCIVLTASGRVAVGDVQVAPGHAAFVPAGERTTLSGAGQVFIATVGT